MVTILRRLNNLDAKIMAQIVLNHVGGNHRSLIAQVILTIGREK